MRTSEAGPSSRMVEINGASLYVEEHGQGPPLLLIHGSLVSHVMWNALIPYLVGQFKVITIDTRGHGLSTNPSGTHALESITDDVAAVIDDLKLDRPAVCGWSKGGQVSLELGRRHPEIMSALLVGGALTPDFVPAFRRFMRRMLAVDESGTIDFDSLDVLFGPLAQRFKAMHPGGDQQWQTVVRQISAMVDEYAGIPDDVMRQIDTPTLVFGGDRDNTIPLDVTTSLYRSLPNAELAILPNTDHFSLMLQASLLGAIIVDFLERHPVH